MSKGFLKKCLENLKIVAPLTLAGFIVFGLFGAAIWALFHFTNIIFGFIATYIVTVLFVTWLFTSFVYEEPIETPDPNSDLPFMPGNDNTEG